MVESRKYDTNKLADLIEQYIKNDSGSAGIEISNMIIEGEDLIDALDNIEYAKIDHKKKLKEEIEQRKNLINDLEKLLGAKQGSFPDKIREIIKQYPLKK